MIVKAITTEEFVQKNQWSDIPQHWLEGGSTLELSSEKKSLQMFQCGKNILLFFYYGGTGWLAWTLVLCTCVYVYQFYHGIAGA